MKRLLVILFICCFPFSLKAQHHVDAYFSNMPQAVLLLLDKTARLDMIDLYNSNLASKAENIYGGQSELLRKTDDYLYIKCTDASSWQMKLLPMAHDTLIVCVSSVSGVNTYSRLTYYKTDWHVVKRDSPMPNLNMFIKPEGNVKRTETLQLLLEGLRDCPMQITLSEGEPILNFSLNCASLPVEAKEKVHSLLLPSISYKWESGKWVIVANQS